MTAARAVFGLADGEIDPIRALILHAYVGLRVERVGSSLGVREIQESLARFAPLAETLTDATIQRTLAAAAVIHRGRGQPATTTRELMGEMPTPFLPVRRNTPKGRHRR
jgi:hypothetical protein